MPPSGPVKNFNKAGRHKNMSGISHVTDASFEQEVLKASSPVLEEISGEYAGKLKVAKLNIDENPQTPPKYGIRGIPTLMLFKNGQVEATKVGAVSKSQLAAFIDGNL